MEPKNFDTYISIVRCDAAFKDRLRRHCREHNTTISKMVRYALERTYPDLAVPSK